MIKAAFKGVWISLVTKMAANFCIVPMSKTRSHQKSMQQVMINSNPDEWRRDYLFIANFTWSNVGSKNIAHRAALNDDRRFGRKADLLCLG